MRIEILGSGGAITTPRPGCDCDLCQTARHHGVPYARTGPSIFVHDIKLLIDTPEESKAQINRAAIHEIKAGLYSHWHPDHTAGSRMWESLANDWRKKRDPAYKKPPEEAIPVYLPQHVAAEWPNYLGLHARFAFLEHIGAISVQIIPPDTPLQLDHFTITPIVLAETYVSAFLCKDGQKRVLIAMDELNKWSPPALLHGVDLAIMPMGLPQRHPLTGAVIISPEHPIYDHEASLEQTVAMVRQMQPKRVVFMHVEEAFGLWPHELQTTAHNLQSELGCRVEWACDGMQIVV